MQEKEEEFKQGMELMCFMVNATYEAYKRNKTEVFKVSHLSASKLSTKRNTFVHFRALRSKLRESDSVEQVIYQQASFLSSIYM